MKYSILLAGLISVASALPVSAQEPGVSRRLFTFLDDRLTVEVQADRPGSLQIVRGEPGLVDVVARVPGGVSAFAMGGRDGDALRLTAVGGDKADFVVVVPEDAYVRVRLPNKKGTEIGSTRPGGTFSWPSDEKTTNAGGVTGVSASKSRPASGPLIAYAAATAPQVLSIPKLTTVRTVRVRIADAGFEVGGSRPMGVARGNTQHIEVQTGNEPEDLVLSIPSDTRDFTLTLGGRTALVKRGVEVVAYCEPVTEQTLAGGVKWFTFSPEAGRLTCR
jgi:hypothetical protein